MKATWTSLIADGIKPLENRSRRTTLRGRFLIHASCASRNAESFETARKVTGTVDYADYLKLLTQGYKTRKQEEFPYGAIIGVAEITGCIRNLRTKTQTMELHPNNLHLDKKGLAQEA